MGQVIFTTNPNAVVLCSYVERTSDAYWTGFDMSWTGSQWEFDSFQSSFILEDAGSPTWVLGYRPETIRITYGVSSGGTHDWIFLLKDTGGGTIADSGVISDPGLGTFVVEMSIDFSASLDIQILETKAGTGGNPPTFNTGFISGIEFCS